MFRSAHKQLLTGVSAISLGVILAGPAVAADFEDPIVHKLSAHAEVFGGHSWVDGSAVVANEDSDFFLLGGNVRVHFPMGDTLSFQADFDGEGGFVDSGVNDSYGGGFAVGGHLSYRQPEHYLFGVFGGMGVGDPEDTDSTGRAAPFFFSGVEAQWHVDNFTLYGQVGYVDSNHPSNFEVLDNAWFVRGVARAFLSDYTMAQGEIAFADGQNDIDGVTDDVDVLQWGARVEHQFHDVGFTNGFLSGFAEYRGMYVDDDNGGGANGEFTDHTILVGLKIAVNQPNLRSHYRNGPGLSLPNFARMITEVVYTD